MIITKEISTFADAMECFFDDSYSKSINRIRSNYVFRGMRNADYTLQTSLERNCKDKLYLEKNILRNFSKYAQIDYPGITSSIWYQMILGQHHGLPTRLMDWTYSPLVALHFATDNTALDALDKNDGVVWKINLEELNALFPTKYSNVLRENGAFVFTVDLLDRVTGDLATYDSDMGHRAILFLEPPSIDSRIINQFSIFAVMPSSINKMEDFLADNTTKSYKFIIKKEIKWLIRDMLDQMNLNERIMFPGLDGLAIWLKRHYYVK